VQKAEEGCLVEHLYGENSRRVSSVALHNQPYKLTLITFFSTGLVISTNITDVSTVRKSTIIQ
jgi:hypothetical protein